MASKRRPSRRTAASAPDPKPASPPPKGAASTRAPKRAAVSAARSGTAQQASAAEPVSTTDAARTTTKRGAKRSTTKRGSKRAAAAKAEPTSRAASKPPAAKRRRTRKTKDEAAEDPPPPPGSDLELRVRRMHRRDANRVWEFLKLVFRDVNRETVEYQRPRSKQRFLEQYDDDVIVQLLFEVGGDIVGYAECAFEVTGSDTWINPRYFDNRDMRPMFVEELASHPDYQGRGIGSFVLEQLQHLARVRGCTHLVLEVAENNRHALAFYRRRNFFKLDAAIFLAKKVPSEPELLPPRSLADFDAIEDPEVETPEASPPGDADSGDD